MKIIDFDRTIDKNYLAQQAHEICTRAAFPVDYQDVYNHLFEKENLSIAIDNIKEKYGKNAILKATSLLNDSTIRDRNKKIGGHTA